MQVITVDIADDHKMVLNGIENMLSAYSNIRVGHMYHNGRSLLAGLKAKRPDVLLLDIQMPDVGGEELTALIARAYPEIAILAITGFDHISYVRKMLEKGALGYILKNTDEVILKLAIETVYRRQQFVDPSLRERLIQDMIQHKKLEAQKPILTKREKEILKLIVNEHTSQQIADTLSLSIRTIENQRVNLMQKLKVKNTAGLVKVAFEYKLVE